MRIAIFALTLFTETVISTATEPMQNNTLEWQSDMCKDEFIRYSECVLFISTSDAETLDRQVDNFCKRAHRFGRACSRFYDNIHEDITQECKNPKAGTLGGQFISNMSMRERKINCDVWLNGSEKNGMSSLLIATMVLISTLFDTKVF